MDNEITLTADESAALAVLLNSFDYFALPDSPQGKELQRQLVSIKDKLEDHYEAQFLWWQELGSPTYSAVK